MLVKISASNEQIRWYAQAALNGFETLDLETAAEVAQSELRALIRYLDALDNADNTVVVDVVGGVEPRIVLKSLVCDRTHRDYFNLKVVLCRLLEWLRVIFRLRPSKQDFIFRRAIDDVRLECP